MTLTLPVPSSPSSTSTDSPNVPHTPVSPTNLVQTLSLPPSDQSSTPSTTNTSPGPLNLANPQAKRKPSRRANTAERRATHNAVERQRRETLNGRFLDLAALLPNLSQIRRPSKSAIVNSSIAHIHASRRHRAMASRELRLLKLEADALRRELNEWRVRANHPRVEEPVRSEAFSMVLNGEVEILTSIPGMDEEDEEGLGDNEDDLPVRAIPAGISRSIPEDAEDLNSMPATVKPATNPFAPNVPTQQQGAPHLTHILPRPASHRPFIAQDISSVSFENPAMSSLYDQQTHVPSQQYQMQFNVGHPLDVDKSATWNNQIFATQQLQQQLANQHGMFPPSTPSHGPSSNSTGHPFSHQAYYQGPPRQQPPVQHIYGSPVDSEDAVSVSSASGFGERDRSTSMSGSTYGSPQGARAGSVSSGSYEVPGILASGGIPARMSAGSVMWSSDEMENMAAFKPNIPSVPIAVGGGGSNGGGFAMMM
ncbi:hypothetical protein BJV78DRAFT_1152894 [Lactifluus subvellereus]|nr:hypothetical protein BJV78DRAFT_1152894 [Lactifluus subvellereus]